MYSRSALGVAAALLLVVFVAHTNAENCARGQIGYKTEQSIQSTYPLPPYAGQYGVPIPIPKLNNVGAEVVACDPDDAGIAVFMVNIEEAVLTRTGNVRSPITVQINVYYEDDSAHED